MGCSSSKHRVNADGKYVPHDRNMAHSIVDAKLGSGSMTRGNKTTLPILKPDREAAECGTICDSQASLKHNNEVNQKRLSAVEDAVVNSPAWDRDNPYLSKIRTRDSKCFSAWNSPISSFRSTENFDSEMGLRFLLSPLATPGKSFSTSARCSALYKTLTFSPAHWAAAGSDSALATPTKHVISEDTIPSEMDGMGDSEELGSPLFDPSILETFEKAIATSSTSSWDNSDVSVTSSSKVVDTCSDADSPQWSGETQTDKNIQVGKANTDQKDREMIKKWPFSDNYRLGGVFQAKEDILERFDSKCPPGCEDKVVLYITSLRGIRKTYEDCGYVRMILKGYGVQVYERDVWMHSKFRQELTHVMGIVLNVPRLFVKGRYIGGVEDVKHLHEDDILGFLLVGLPEERNNVCGLCGGFNFIPCTTCNGSRKMKMYDKASCCPDCNENGLILCPSCDW